MTSRKLVVLPCLPLNARTSTRYLHQLVLLSLAKLQYPFGLPIGHPFAQQRQVNLLLLFIIYISFWVLMLYTVPVYDGRNRQLKVPDELGKIPNTLPRYVGSIPEYSLALVAYTVSTYVAPSGPRKDLITANLHIQFGVVLHEPTVMSTEDGSDDEGRENE